MSLALYSTLPCERASYGKVSRDHNRNSCQRETFHWVSMIHEVYRVVDIFQSKKLAICFMGVEKLPFSIREST